MQIFTNTVEDYINSIPEDRKTAMQMLRTAIKSNISEAYEETMSYGMIGYVVPHSVYPAGYHCSPELPLPFVAIASQKNFIALYHMGLYAEASLHEWFVTEYPKHCKFKLDMGKSCIRFKKIEDIPYALIGELIKKMTTQEWIVIYEKNYKK